LLQQDPSYVDQSRVFPAELRVHSVQLGRIEFDVDGSIVWHQITPSKFHQTHSIAFLENLSRLATGFTTGPGSNHSFCLSGLAINPRLITGYDSADETLVVRILEQLTSVDTPLSLSGRQFMRRFSTVFLALAELMWMPNN
jgi:hypothetical protein